MTQRRADVGLVLLTVVWGTTFSVVHEAVRTFPPLALIALRFAIASLAFAPILWRSRAELRSCLAPGLALGGLLFAGFATQTIGLAGTTPARAGFITGLSVVLVPVIGLAFGQRPPRRAAVGVALAVIGLAVVSFGCRIPWLGCATVEPVAARTQVVGDLWVLACAVAFALHVIGVSHWTTQHSPVCLNGIQIAVVAVLGFVLTGVVDGAPPAPSASVLLAAAFLGVVATALALAVWLTLQRHTTATHAALIFALEPVFAAFFSWLWTGEGVTLAVWGGGALMVLGVVVAEVPVRGRLEAVAFLRWLADDPMAR